MDESERILPKSKIKQQNIFSDAAMRGGFWSRGDGELYGQHPDRLSVIAVAFFPVDQARGNSELKKKPIK